MIEYYIRVCVVVSFLQRLKRIGICLSLIVGFIVCGILVGYVKGDYSLECKCNINWLTFPLFTPQKKDRKRQEYRKKQNRFSTGFKKTKNILTVSNKKENLISTLFICVS